MDLLFNRVRGLFKWLLLLVSLCHSSFALALSFLEPGQYEISRVKVINSVLVDGALVSTIKSDLDSETGVFTQTITPRGGDAIVQTVTGAKGGTRCVPTSGATAGTFCPLVAKSRPDGFYDFVMSCEQGNVTGKAWKFALVPNSKNLWTGVYSGVSTFAGASKPVSQTASISGLEAVLKNAKPTNPEEAKKIQEMLSKMPQASEQAKASEETQRQLIASMKAQSANLSPAQKAAQDAVIAQLENPTAKISYQFEVLEVYRKLSTTCEATEPLGNPLIRRPKIEPKLDPKVDPKRP